MADGGLRRSESAALTWGDVDYYQDCTARITIQKGKNQPEPLIVALTETTARALRGIQPDGADLAAPVFGLTGDTLANRVCAAARAAGLGEDFSVHSGRIVMALRMVAAGAPTATVQHQGRWKHGDMVARYTRGEALGDQVGVVAASIGPPPSGDGNPQQRIRVQATSLQWGHRLSAMETGKVAEITVDRVLASMRPPPFGDGNSVWPPRSSGTASSFNGATAFRRWKGSENIRGNRQHPYFNGAVAELQKITYRGKDSRKGLELGNNRKYPLWA